MGRKAKGIINEEGRTCTKCGEFKVWGEFNNHKIGINGKHSKCRGCFKKYGEENKEAIAENKKQYREENRDVIAAKKKQYREENREAIAEYKKQWYEENRDAVLAQKKQYYEDNRDVRTEYKKQWNISPAKYKTFKDKLTTFESPRESKDGYMEVKCAMCEKYFIPTNGQVQSRVQGLNGTSSGENRFYCSDSCKDACSVFGRRKYPKGFKKPSNREFEKEFRTMILERDNYTCQVCNKQFDKKHLQAHHVTPVVCSPMGQVDIDNGICVCKECHINLHLTQEGIAYAELIEAGKGKEDKEENIN